MPRLCPSYLRDLLQFIERGAIEQRREVSRNFNDVACATPESRLPRRRLWVDISMVRSIFL
jgi:hypothetical protein